MAKKKKSPKNQDAPTAVTAAVEPARAVAAINPHSTDGEKSDWGAKLDQPWSPPPRAAEEAPPDEKKKKKADNTPSVMGFLSRVAGASAAQGKTPARGLLGKITAEDLRAVGRNEAADSLQAVAPEKTNGHAAEAAATVQVGLLDPPKTDPGLTPGERLARLKEMTADETGSRDQRKNDRFGFQVMVEYSTVGRTCSEVADNLSATGLFIHTSTPLEVGDPVMVNFTVPDSSFPLTFPARVKWVSAFGELNRPQSGMGLEFTALDDKRRRALAAIIARLRGGRRT